MPTGTERRRRRDEDFPREKRRGESGWTILESVPQTPRLQYTQLSTESIVPGHRHGENTPTMLYHGGQWRATSSLFETAKRVCGDFQLRATGDLPEEVTAQMGPQVDGEDVRLLRLREQAW